MHWRCEVMAAAAIEGFLAVTGDMIHSDTTNDVLFDTPPVIHTKQHILNIFEGLVGEAHHTPLNSIGTLCPQHNSLLARWPRCLSRTCTCSRLYAYTLA